MQFLRQLHEQGDLHYERAAGAWRWELEAIRGRGMTANVVELMLGQLRRLPASTQALLAQAAGLGEVFSLGELMALAELSAADTAMRLWPALQAGLLQPLSEDYRFSDSPALLAKARYRFLHDRVQQAAHELTPPEQRAALLLQTGRRLLAGSTEAELEQRLFTVLECLNQALPLIDEPAERARLLALNLRGAEKARAAAAHPLAVQLLRQALRLQPSDAAQTLQLYLALCESSYLAGDFAAAEALYPAARAACPQPLAQAQLLAVQADQLHIQGRFGDAFDVLLEALALLGQPFPADEAAAMAAFPAEFGATLQMLATHPAQGLPQAPELQDPEQLLLLRLLYALTFSTYQTGRFAAFVVDACRMLRITLQHGQCDLSAIACLAMQTALSVAKQPYADMPCHRFGGAAPGRAARQPLHPRHRLPVLQCLLPTLGRAAGSQPGTAGPRPRARAGGRQPAVGRLLRAAALREPLHPRLAAGRAGAGGRAQPELPAGQPPAQYRGHAAPWRAAAAAGLARPQPGTAALRQRGPGRHRRAAGQRGPAQHPLGDGQHGDAAPRAADGRRAGLAALRRPPRSDRHVPA